MITMSEFDKNSENIDEDDDLEYLINLYGRDILSSPGMQSEKTFRQHGRMSVYEHSLAVARMCLRIAKHFPGEVDIRSLVRAHFCMIISYTIGIYRMKAINGMVSPMREMP